MIGRVDDVACSCQDGKDGESKRYSYEYRYFQGFGGVFRGISLSKACTASLDLIETDLEWRKHFERLD